MPTREELAYSLRVARNTDNSVVAQALSELLLIDEAVRQPYNTADKSTFDCFIQREKEWCKVMADLRREAQGKLTALADATERYRRVAHPGPGLGDARERINAVADLDIAIAEARKPL